MSDAFGSCVAQDPGDGDGPGEPIGLVDGVGNGFGDLPGPGSPVGG